MPTPPKRRLAVITCMDARIDPARILGFGEGDAHVIRNGGGDAREALRSLLLSQHLLETREVALIRHTDCGLSGGSNDAIRQKVTEASGGDASEIDFLPFADLEEAVRDDIRFLESSPLLAPGSTVRGYVYDVETRSLQEVAP